MEPSVFRSFTGLSNISEQSANPPGIRRIGVIAVKDLKNVREWPLCSEAMQVTKVIPITVDKKIAIIIPADNSAFMTFENQGDRYYQSYKYNLGFEIAGLTNVQSVEFRKYINTGCIFFVEYHDGEIRVIGSKLSPIVLKSKGDSGKKGGDKRGYTLTGDNDSYITEPPFYPGAFALPGMDGSPAGFSYGFSFAFNT